MKAIRLLLILVLSCLSATTYAQAPSWEWARGATGNGYDYSTSMSMDSKGNVYVVGNFSRDSIIFDGHVLFRHGNDTSNGNYNIFIAEYSPSGNLRWIKSAGGTGHSTANGVCIDANGNIYMVGGVNKIYAGGHLFVDTMTFDQIVLSNLDTLNSSDLFFVKYDSLGNALWAKFIENGGRISGISADFSNNIYITGYFYGDLILDNITLRDSGFTDMFIAKFNPTGSVVWAKSAGGNSQDEGECITTDGYGNVYVAGTFLSDSIAFDNKILTNPGFAFQWYDVFVVKYDSTGSVVWAKKAQGSNASGSDGICADIKGNIYLTGHYQSTSMLFDSIVLPNAGIDNFFIVKYDASGKAVWVRGAGGIIVWPSAVACDAIGNAYVTGYFQGDSATFGSFTLNNAGFDDIFIVKYDSSGNAVWAKRAGGRGLDGAKNICSDSIGDLYIAGFNGSDSIVFGNTILTNLGTLNFFIAKLDTTLTTGMTVINSQVGHINVYPNPSTGIFYFTGMKEGDQIEVCDLMGQRVASARPSPKGEGGTASIDLSGNAPGVYFYRITNQGNTVQQGKMVVE